MAYNELNCVAVLGNTGLANCKDNLGYDAKLLWTTKSFEFASEADAEDESKYEDAINAGSMYPMPLFKEVEPTLEDDVEQETATGASLFVREGKYGGIGRFETAQCNLANLRTFNEVDGRAFIITSNGKIFGTSPDGVKFRGFDLSKFHVSYQKGTDGSTVRWTEIRYQFEDPTQMGDYGAIPQLTWNPLNLAGVVDCTVTVNGTPTTTELVVDVARNCDGEVVTGLVIGDFIVLDSTGNTETPDTVTESPNGTYTFDYTGTPLTVDSYTVNLKDPADQTTGGYESATAASFSIT
jgi:hypothetical protein